MKCVPLKHIFWRSLFKFDPKKEKPWKWPLTLRSYLVSRNDEVHGQKQTPRRYNLATREMSVITIDPDVLRLLKGLNSISLLVGDSRTELLKYGNCENIERQKRSFQGTELWLRQINQCRSGWAQSRNWEWRGWISLNREGTENCKAPFAPWSSVPGFQNNKKQGSWWIESR